MSCWPANPFPKERLATVRRVTDEIIAERAKFFEEKGSVFCGQCAWQGFEKDAIQIGVFQYNEKTKLFDIPAKSGAVIYECPRCHMVDRTVHFGDSQRGIMFFHPSHLLKGEWRSRICEDDRCQGKGGLYIEMGCPICGEFYIWHHASNAPKWTHAWTVNIEGDVLTMSPSLFENPPKGCHYFIRDGKVA